MAVPVPILSTFLRDRLSLNDAQICNSDRVTLSTLRCLCDSQTLLTRHFSGHNCWPCLLHKKQARPSGFADDERVDKLRIWFHSATLFTARCGGISSTNFAAFL